jgi:hypothetical protein
MVEPDGVDADRRRSAKSRWIGLRASALAAVVVSSWIAAQAAGAEEPTRDRPPVTAEAAKPDVASVNSAERQRQLLLLLLLNNAALRPLAGFGR